MQTYRFYIRCHHNLLLGRRSVCHVLGHCLTRQGPEIKFKIDEGARPVTNPQLEDSHIAYCCIHVSWSVKPRGTGCGKIHRLISWFLPKQEQVTLVYLMPSTPEAIHSYVDRCTLGEISKSMDQWILASKISCMTRTCCSWHCCSGKFMQGLQAHSPLFNLVKLFAPPYGGLLRF